MPGRDAPEKFRDFWETGPRVEHGTAVCGGWLFDGEWGDWIALWGLINMLEIPVAIVSSLGETGLNVIYSAHYQNETQATGDMTLLGHEAELH